MTPDTFYWTPEPCQPLAVTTAAGLAVAADVRGQGSGVILVHGLGFDRSHWVEQAERLATAGHRVVTYDLRGFGDSEPSPSHYLAADLAEDLEAVRTAAGLERFHLVGHSLGGMVAQHYVLNHPDRVSRLVLASTTSHSGVRASAYGSALARLSAKGFDKAMEDPDLRAGLMATVQMLNDPEIRASLEGVIPEGLPGGDALLDMLRRITARPNTARSHAWRTTVGFSTRDRLGEIRCPTLVMHGTHDTFIPFVAGQLTARGIPGSTWIPIEGAGHDLPREHPSDFGGSVESFLVAD